jgi:GDP-D-mannose dehydratase
MRTTLRYLGIADHVQLRGHASKTKNELRWAPIVRLEELGEMIVAADLQRIGFNRAAPTHE